jgi:hypothetical protein
MQRPLARLAVLVAVVVAAGLASCRGESPTESVLEQSLFGSRDSSSGDSIPGDTIPNDTLPPDTIPPDTIPPDTIPPDTIPPDTIPPDTIPPDTIPPDTIPPDTIPPDTIPPDTIPPDTIPPDTIPPDTTPPIRAFALIVTVVGADSSGDTLQTVRLQGARVRLLRFDSLPDSTSIPNADTRTRLTERNGMVTFRRLRPAWYRVEVSPPRESAYLPGSALVAPATTERVPVQVLLLPAP